MKRLVIILVSILAVMSIACTGGLPSIDPGTLPGGGGGGTGSTGFPSDFPQITDAGGSGSGTTLSGFGGDTSKDQNGNRAAVSKNPVILLHGNGGNANHTQWGWVQTKAMLKAAGYNDSEIWAVSYLGANNGSADMSDPHRNNVDDVRNFIDAVRTYLNVQKVDIVGHSLGCGLARSYMLGLKKSGSFDNSNHRLDAVGTLVTLAGANYGLGMGSMSEFKTGSSWERGSHVFQGTTDDTPWGSDNTANQTGSYKKVTSKDNNKIAYVGLWAIGDFVDNQNSNTGRLQGANLNKGYSLGASLTGHEKIIKDQTVFNAYLAYLNMNPNAGGTDPDPDPDPDPDTITVSISGGGEFTDSTTATIAASESGSTIQYKIDAGAWQNYTGPVTITSSCTLTAKATKSGFTDSSEVTATFTKKVVPTYQEVSGTATQHYTAGRLTISQYIAMGGTHGYVSAFSLYSVDNGQTWTDVKP